MTLQRNNENHGYHAKMTGIGVSTAYRGRESLNGLGQKQ